MPANCKIALFSEIEKKTVDLSTLSAVPNKNFGLSVAVSEILMFNKIDFMLPSICSVSDHR